MDIVETKTEDLIQGRAQLFLLLHGIGNRIISNTQFVCTNPCTAASVMNNARGLEIFPLYGVVTSASIWEFYIYLV